MLFLNSELALLLKVKYYSSLFCDNTLEPKPKLCTDQECPQKH